MQPSQKWMRLFLDKPSESPGVRTFFLFRFFLTFNDTDFCFPSGDSVLKLQG